ncbi:MAG: hypothetical protein P8Z76_16975 [Alphaproteobacteria bacterium]
MDERSAIFLQIMIGVAIVGLVGFLVVLVGRYVRGPQAPGGSAGNVAARARWPELLLALVAAIAVAVIVIWQFPPIEGSAPAAKTWRSEPRTIVFFVVMLVAAGVGLLAFLVYLFARKDAPPVATAGTREDAQDEAAAPPAEHETPKAGRLLGLLLLGVAVLLLAWIHLPKVQQYGLMLYVLYPASAAVALVMLFDKATRAWSAKPASATMREWLLCDAVTFLLILGFLNLLGSNAGEKYASVHWDMLHIAAFFFVFWLLDRKLTRLRFLVAYAYLIALPILFLIWRGTQGIEAAKDAGFWGSIWPFFILAIIFFVLEIFALAVRRDSEVPPDAGLLPTLKDTVFVIAYGVLLLIAA